MKDPIFKHPKVHDWSGGKSIGGWDPEPYTKNESPVQFVRKYIL